MSTVTKSMFEFACNSLYITPDKVLKQKAIPSQTRVSGDVDYPLSQFAKFAKTDVSLQVCTITMVFLLFFV